MRRRRAARRRRRRRWSPSQKTARGWGGGDSNNDGGYRAGERLRLAVWVGIAGIVMFFAAISSAMVVRRIGDDWLALDLPAVPEPSTAILLFSSVAPEITAANCAM
ncbi:MAG: hypothetical protein R2748_15410 [Bryobacterales bacterium]